jgi:hypothetical protein
MLHEVKRIKEGRQAELPVYDCASALERYEGKYPE